MTSLDKSGVKVNALGAQAQSQRKTAPCWGISKVGRDARSKVFITEGHIKPIRLGRESPIGGAIYDLPTTLNPKPEIRFAQGKRGEVWGKPKDDPGDIPTNEALAIIPDSQQFKYPKQADVKIGTDARGKLKEAELMKAHSAAFFGREGPGPAGVGGDGGPDFTMTKPRLGAAQPFGVKTALKPDWTETSFIPPEVGPGKYPRTDTAMGPQYLSIKRNQSVFSFPKAPQHPKDKSVDSISKLDAARSSIGKQTLAKNKSAPAIGFNVDTRASRGRSQVCRTRDDQGPSAFMPKQVFRMPTLPPEKVILAGGIG